MAVIVVKGKVKRIQEVTSQGISNNVGEENKKIFLASAMDDYKKRVFSLRSFSVSQNRRNNS